MFIAGWAGSRIANVFLRWDEVVENPRLLLTFVQQAGLWYDPDFNGQGFDVNVRNGKLSVVWYTFNHRNDMRRFYIGTCDLAEAASGFDLFTTDDGAFDDPTAAQAILAGQAQLYFTDDTNAVFNFNMLEHGRGSVNIVSLAASNDPSSGLWFQVSREKEGFGIKFFGHLNSCMAYWYTYGRGRSAPESPGIASPGCSRSPR